MRKADQFRRKIFFQAAFTTLFTITTIQNMAKRTFENALKRLEQITSELEEGEPSLDKSLKKFNEGIELVKFCNTTLEEARQKVDLLIKQNNGLESVDFVQDKQDNGYKNIPE